MLVSCGGGSDSENTKTPNPNDGTGKPLPVAVIKTSSAIATVGEIFELDGSKSYFQDGDGDKYKNIIAYAWAADKENRLNVTLEGAKSKKAHFIVEGSIGTTYLSFTLTITDIYGRTARARKIIEFKGDAEELPVAVVTDPPDQLHVGETVTLDGTKSYYLDGNGDDDKFENIKSWRWHQKASDKIHVALTNDEEAQTRLIVPDSFIGNDDIHIILTVTDKHNRTDTEELVITMSGGDAANDVFAIIDGPSSAKPESEVKLSGFRSHYDDGRTEKKNIIKYEWSQMSTDLVRLKLITDSANPYKLSFIAPALPSNTEKLDLHLTLTVTDIHRRKHTESKLVRISDKILYSVSGKVTIKSDSHLDGDINEPRAVFKPNDSFATAQYITNPAQVVGYINKPGEGNAGRSKTKGDRADFYKLSITAGQRLRVQYFVGTFTTEKVEGEEPKDKEDPPRVLMKTTNNFDLYIYDDAQNLITRFDSLHYCQYVDKDNKPDTKLCAATGSLVGKTENENNYIETFKDDEGREFHKLTAFYTFEDNVGNSLPTGDYYVQVYAGLGASNYKLSVLNAAGQFKDVPQALDFGLLDVTLFDPYEVFEKRTTLYFTQAIKEDSEGNSEKGAFYYVLTDVAAGKYRMWAAVDMDNDGIYNPFLLEPKASPKGLDFGQLDIEQDIENQDYSLEINAF